MIVNSYRRVLTVPPTQASGLVASEVSDTQLRLTWVSTVNVIIVARLTSSTTVLPVGNTTYDDNSAFGSGDNLGSGNYVVYKGNANTVLITGLTNTTDYTFIAYAFSIIGEGTEKYNTSSATLNPITQTTLPPQVAPVTQATNLVFATDRYASCTAGNGTHRLWLYNTGGAINGSFLPVDNTSYTAGEVLGGGNTVGGVGTGSSFIITGLPYATSVAHRVFEYNIASGNPKYNTNTATGNPLVQDTIAEPLWYLYHNSIAQSDRHEFGVQNESRTASKSYSCAVCETSTEFLMFTIGDNLQGPSGVFHYDQTFLRIKSKADGLPFQEGWDWYKDVDGYPIAVLASGYPDADGTSIQNWLATPVVIADDELVAYYSYNFGNIAARYSVGKATSTDGGRTWTRQGTNISGLPGGEDHFQFQQAIYNTTLSRWEIFSPNARTGSNGRWTSLRIYVSTDGATGLAFSKLANDIVLDTDIDVNGFGLFGPPWKTGGRYYFQYNAIPLMALHTTPATNINAKAYEYGAYSTLQKQIVLVSVAEPLTSGSIARIEHINYESDLQTTAGIFPGSAIISHGGANHILVNRFLYKPEDNTQISIDVCVMSDTPYTGHGAQTIGRNVYPGYMLRFFKMHQCHLDDTYLSTTTQGIEVITNTPLTLGGTGTNPAQFCMNSVILTPGNKYPVGASFTHSQTDFGIKMMVNALTAVDSINRGLVEKAGTFKMFLFQGNKLEVWLYGVGGGIKKYRTTNNLSTYFNELWIPSAATRLGFTAKLNGGGTDIDIKINVDYALDVALTTIQAATFTQIIQNSNDITFGHTSTETDCNKFLGGCVIMSGSEVTQQNWLEENNI